MSRELPSGVSAHVEPQTLRGLLYYSGKKNAAIIDGMKSDFIGVQYHKRDRFYLAHVKYQQNRIWLKTYYNPAVAANVHDVAARWLHGPDAKLNFSQPSLPQELSESHIVQWLLDGGVPLKTLTRCVPLPILLETGLTPSDLMAAGVPIQDVLAITK